MMVSSEVEKEDANPPTEDRCPDNEKYEYDCKYRRLYSQRECENYHIPSPKRSKEMDLKMSVEKEFDNQSTDAVTLATSTSTTTVATTASTSNTNTITSGASSNKITMKRMNSNGSISISQNTTTLTAPPDFFCDPVNTRPILVGYAFGPKKMNTMGLIMAEASQSITTFLYRDDNEDDEDVDENGRRYFILTQDEEGSCGRSCADDDDDENDQYDDELEASEERIASASAQPPSPTTMESADTVSTAKKTYPDVNASVNVTDHITTTTATTLSLLSSSLSSSTKTTQIRVSFVPLDLDSPLEDQQGGSDNHGFDVVLHKLTEDILSVSRSNDESSSLLPPTTSASDSASRIQRLHQYGVDHPCCAIVDDPVHVAPLMCRSDMARVLSECLKGATALDGTPVRTPKHFVLRRMEDLNQLVGATTTTSDDQSSLSPPWRHIPTGYPTIVKPLTAAGTVNSHKMGIVLNRDGIGSLIQKMLPCLLQEYSNHGGILHKVYVLGTQVRVYSRPSLPDLPRGERERRQQNCGDGDDGDCPSYVEFDSQRTYPQPADFGVIGPSSPSPLQPLLSTTEAFHTSLTAEDVRPIAERLSRAFGLQLFGFDVLVVTSSSSLSNPVKKEMLVVDVNYFPSYKEVPKFPYLLAHHLTQLAIAGRLKCASMKNKEDNFTTCDQGKNKNNG